MVSDPKFNTINSSYKHTKTTFRDSNDQNNPYANIHTFSNRQNEIEVQIFPPRQLTSQCFVSLKTGEKRYEFYPPNELLYTLTPHPWKTGEIWVEDRPGNVPSRTDKPGPPILIRNKTLKYKLTQGEREALGVFHENNPNVEYYRIDHKTNKLKKLDKFNGMCGTE